jgi:HTH-type transcriptional regulator/antitoxin HigA
MINMVATTYAYSPDLVFPPGDTLSEVLDDLGMTQTELARRTGLSTKHINQIIRGQVGITPETALLLEKATGIHAATWNRLEVAHQEFRSRQDEAKTLAADVGWLDLIPYKELVARGLVAASKDPIDRVRELCRFFGVANFAAWEAVWHKPTAYRTSAAFTSEPGAVAAWLRLGEIRAAAIATQPFDKAGLNSHLETFRALTRDPDPDSWWPKLTELCASIGVALVGEPEIKGARINGAARWLNSDKAIVQLSFRHKWSDIVWFTFFHEIAHLLIHSKKDAFINDDKTKHSGHEQEADAYASQLLIPRRREAELSQLVTNADVDAFAEDIGIAPGIVVGRLQFEHRWTYNRGVEFKQRFTLR